MRIPTGEKPAIKYMCMYSVFRDSVLLWVYPRLCVRSTRLNSVWSAPVVHICGHQRFVFDVGVRLEAVTRQRWFLVGCSLNTCRVMRQHRAVALVNRADHKYVADFSSAVAANHLCEISDKSIYLQTPTHTDTSQRYSHIYISLSGSKRAAQRAFYRRGVIYFYNATCMMDNRRLMRHDDAALVYRERARLYYMNVVYYQVELSSPCVRP